MAHATGTRLASAVLFFIGTITIIGIPSLYPVAWHLYKKADEIEEEREAELDALTG